MGVGAGIGNGWGNGVGVGIGNGSGNGIGVGLSICSGIGVGAGIGVGIGIGVCTGAGIGMGAVMGTGPGSGAGAGMLLGISGCGDWRTGSVAILVQPELLPLSAWRNMSFFFNSKSFSSFRELIPYQNTVFERTCGSKTQRCGCLFETIGQNRL